MPNGNLVMGPPTDPELEQEFPPVPGATLLTRDPRGPMFPENASFKQPTAAKPWERNWATPSAQKPWERNWAAPTDQGQFIRSELFPWKYNPVTKESRLAIPGFVKELAGAVKSAEETPYAYDPTTGETHVSPEMIKAGVTGALAGVPFAPEAEAAGVAAKAAIPESFVDPATKMLRVPDWEKPWPPPSGASPLTPVEQAAKIKSEAGKGIQAAKESEAVVAPSEARQLLNQIRKDTESEYNPETHDAAKGFLSKFEKTLTKKPAKKEAPTSFYPPAKIKGVPIADIPEPARSKIQASLGKLEPETAITVKDLHNLRQELNDVHKHANRQGYEQEGMFASKAKSAIDEFMADKMDQFGWSKDMRNYALASTAEEIHQLVNRALYRKTQLSQGQRAAALNTELRNWARPTYKGPNARMRMLRKLSPEAADKMEAIATSADPKSDILKILGTAAPTGVLPFVLDEYAGHLLNAVLGTHGGPLAVMGMGAAAKYFAGQKVMRGINDIIETLNNAADVDKMEELVSPPVSAKMAENPATRQAVINWAKAKGRAKTVAARTLAISLAKLANTPRLVPRIEQEINDLENQ